MKVMLIFQSPEETQKAKSSVSLRIERINITIEVFNPQEAVIL